MVSELVIKAAARGEGRGGCGADFTLLVPPRGEALQRLVSWQHSASSGIRPYGRGQCAQRDLLVLSLQKFFLDLRVEDLVAECPFWVISKPAGCRDGGLLLLHLRSAR